LKRNDRGRLGVGLTRPLGSVGKVLEGSLSLLPATGLETAIGVDEEEVSGNELEQLLDAVLDLLFGRNTGRVDVVNTGADLIGVAVLPEGREELEVTL